MNHRYILEPYKGMDSRFTCPCCGHRRKSFKRYIDTVTQTYLADHVGKCDRLENCAYHFTPREFFKTNPNDSRREMPAVKEEPYFDTIPGAIFAASLRRYDSNIFCMFLARMFGAEAAIGLIEKYKIGTAKHWPGATIFWQVDGDDKVRTGKIMCYNAADCRRIKEPYNHIAWAHTLLRGSESRKDRKTESNAASHGLSRLPGLSDFRLKQCFFGEHLLRLEPYKIVAITESEKTAVIASYYYPNYIWLAAGSLEGLSLNKCRVLNDRTVRLYPDVNGYAKWHSKAREFNNRIPSATFTVDETLFRTATPADRDHGADIADKWINEKLLEWEVEGEF
ncbi:MAG: DUF6371 domain-containing protein [Mucilaginibacter sp.]